MASYQNTKCFLLSAPREIRDKIYGYILEPNCSKPQNRLSLTLIPFEKAEELRNLQRKIITLRKRVEETRAKASAAQKLVGPGDVHPIMSQHIYIHYQMRCAEIEADRDPLPRELGFARANKQIFNEVQDHLRREVTISFHLDTDSFLSSRTMAWLQQAQHITISCKVWEEQQQESKKRKRSSSETELPPPKRQPFTSQLASALAARELDNLHNFEFVGDIAWLCPLFDRSTIRSATVASATVAGRATSAVRKVIKVLERLPRVQAKRCVFRWKEQETLLREDHMLWTDVLKGHERRKRILSELERLNGN